MKSQKEMELLVMQNVTRMAVMFIFGVFAFDVALLFVSLK